MPVLSDEEWERLVMPRVIKGEECWYWFGVTTQGYGEIKIDGTKQLVHRLSLERKLGREIASDLMALHSCYQTRNCVNPDHLREGTSKENAADRAKDGTDRLGEYNGSSKLTEAQVIAIRADVRIQSKIAKDYEVSQVLISKIKSRKAWSHIP